jgi:hypothetical protein
MANDWLRYENQGATRNQPLSPQLIDALSKVLPELGVSMEVFSGGQPTSGPHRTGSHRHDLGNAADVFFDQGGRRLDWRNKADIPVLQEIVRRGRQAGIGGWGAGEGYMQPGSMHVGFGTPSVWGAGGVGDNAPEWLRAAYEGGGRPVPKQYALPTAAPAQPPVMDGLKGAEQLVAANYSTRPQGPLEAAGGGRGADPAIAPPAAPQTPYTPPDGPKGQEMYAAPADAAPAAEKPSFMARLAKNIGKMGTEGGLPGTIAPASGAGPAPPAARIDQPEVPFIDPQGNDQQRQMLAMAMQRLNAGRLF